MPAVVAYFCTNAGDPPSVLEEQKRLLSASAYRPARAYLDRGAVPGQPQLQVCLAALVAGDVLVVATGDRLAHSVDRLLEHFKVAQTRWF